VILLAFEHLWHGEIVPWPPFLTAMNNPADIAPMLHEIATIGIGMAVMQREQVLTLLNFWCMVTMPALST
jgi:hypothetical protein